MASNEGIKHHPDRGLRTPARDMTPGQPVVIGPVPKDTTESDIASFIALLPPETSQRVKVRFVRRPRLPGIPPEVSINPHGK